MTTPNNDDTVKRVRECLNGAVRDLRMGLGNAAWTAVVKESMRRLGGDLGFQVAPRTEALGVPAQREWLYDMVWYKTDEEDRLQEIGLVLESEWSALRGDVKYDFEKLLAARCPLKVLVFQKRSADDMEYLKDGVSRYSAKTPGEIYLFAGFVDGSNYQFDFDTAST